MMKEDGSLENKGKLIDNVIMT